MKLYQANVKDFKNHRNLYISNQNSKTMNKFMEIILGLVLIIAAILVGLSFSSWMDASLSVLKGGILWALLGAGLVLVMLGLSELRG